VVDFLMCRLSLLVAVLVGTAWEAAAFVPDRRVRFSAGPLSRSLSLSAKRKGADLFQEIANIEEGSSPEGGESSVALSEKEKAILAPEETFFEGPPSWTEVIIPAISILTVLGIFPFAASLARQAWVRYKITSRRISIQSGFQGNDFVEITYDEIFGIKYILRSFGAVGDMVIELRDGAKLEMRSVPQFKEVYGYILDKVDEDVREGSDAPPNF